MSKLTKKLRKAVKSVGKVLKKNIVTGAIALGSVVGITELAAVAAPAYKGVQKYAKKVKAVLPEPTGEVIQMAQNDSTTMGNIQAVQEVNYEELYLEYFILVYYPEYYDQLYKGGEK